MRLPFNEELKRAWLEIGQNSHWNVWKKIPNIRQAPAELLVAD